MTYYCHYCGSPARLLCDGPVEGGRCDRPICSEHSHFIRSYIACIRGGRGRNRSTTHTIDYCDSCFEAMPRKKKTETVEPTQPEQPAKNVLDHAEITTIQDSETPNGSPYRPSNASIGESFMAHWCRQCERDVNRDCSVLRDSIARQAKEWQEWNETPLCTAWEQRVTPYPQKPIEVEPLTTTKIYTPTQAAAAVSGYTNYKPENDIVEKPVIPVPTKLPWSSPKTTYQNLEYHLAGDPNTGQGNGIYYYYIHRNGGEIVSEESYPSPVQANTAAREAIKRFGNPKN